METIWPNGKATKDQLVLRIDRAEKILQHHIELPRVLRHRCANHIADALGCVARCLLTEADRALEAAEREAVRIGPDLFKRRTYALDDLRRIIATQRASLPAGPGHPKDGWPA